MNKVWVVEYSDWDVGPYVVGGVVYSSKEHAEEEYAKLKLDDPEHYDGYEIQCYEVKE